MTSETNIDGKCPGDRPLKFDSVEDLTIRIEQFFKNRDQREDMLHELIDVIVILTALRAGLAPWTLTDYPIVR